MCATHIIGQCFSKDDEERTLPVNDYRQRRTIMELLLLFIEENHLEDYKFQQNDTPNEGGWSSKRVNLICLLIHPVWLRWIFTHINGNSRFCESYYMGGGIITPEMPWIVSKMPKSLNVRHCKWWPSYRIVYAINWIVSNKILPGGKTKLKLMHFSLLVIVFMC